MIKARCDMRKPTYLILKKICNDLDGVFMLGRYCIDALIIINEKTINNVSVTLALNNGWLALMRISTRISGAEIYLLNELYKIR